MRFDAASRCTCDEDADVFREQWDARGSYDPPRRSGTGGTSAGTAEMIPGIGQISQGWGAETCNPIRNS